jgi:peptidoglycan/LPS O-acetylase OafA/YrhL
LFETPDKSPGLTRSYYPALDGLRGLAILLILLYHNFSFVSISKIGWIGVDLFFVLSGFLITEILLSEKDTIHFPRNFYMRRILRIFPIYYISLIFFLFILPSIITYPFSLNYFLQNQWWFWLYFQNWLFILNNHGNNFFLDHYWSLALEEQFYLVWPWIIILLGRPKRMLTFLLASLSILLLLRVLVWEIPIDLPYLNLYKFTRIDCLCMGSILAILRTNSKLRLSPLDKKLIVILLCSIFVAFPVIRIIFKRGFPLMACCIYPFLAIAWGWVVYSCLERNTFLSKIFSNRYMRFIGKISYGLYIFHWPVYRLLDKKLDIWFSIPFPSTFSAVLLKSSISTVLAFIIAVISYYCIEIHFLKLKKIFNPFQVTS